MKMPPMWGSFGHSFGGHRGDTWRARRKAESTAGSTMYALPIRSAAAFLPSPKDRRSAA
jgi:hypothetical protein